MNENEEKAQVAVGTAKKSHFTLVKTLKVTLDVDILLDITAFNLDQAIEKANKVKLDECIDEARHNLEELTSKGYRSHTDSTELNTRKAIARAMKTGEDFICVEVTECREQDTE